MYVLYTGDEQDVWGEEEEVFPLQIPIQAPTQTPTQTPTPTSSWNYTIVGTFSFYRFFILRNSRVVSSKRKLATSFYLLLLVNKNLGKGAMENIVSCIILYGGDSGSIKTFQSK